MGRIVWRNTRPTLAIEVIGGAQLGNCYHATTYRITSRRPLTLDHIEALRKAGFLGYGQEFIRKTPLEALTTPVGYDEIVATDSETGERVPEIRGRPTNVHREPYYACEIEDRVDSSD